MLTFIGVILILAAIGLFIYKRIRSKQELQSEEINQRNFKVRQEREADGRIVDSRHLERDINVLPDLGIKINPIIIAVIGVLIIAMNGMFFYANAGTAYAVQYPWGGDKMIKTQGLKTKWYGRVIPLSYEISIQDVVPKEFDEDGVAVIAESKDGIYNRRAHKWEFSDAIKAEIATAVIIGIETGDEDTFLNMADRNRSEAKLIYGRVLPNIDAALKNTAKLMDAQEYISGKASDFDRYFRDQLENGMYLVEEYTQIDEVPEIIGDTNTVRRVVTLNNNKQTKWRIKRDNQGNIMRDNKSNTLSQYGITFLQAQVTGIDWEKSFDDRLQLQKEQVAQTQLEKQEAEKEYYRAKKEVAKGESEKAKERARLEKEQIQLTIAAETRAKVAAQDRIAEEEVVKVSKLKAQSQRVLADAQAYENQRLVNAGLTPQERATLEKEIAIGVAEQIKELKLPTTYISGNDGNGKGGGLLESLLGAEMAKGLLNKKN